MGTYVNPGNIAFKEAIGTETYEALKVYIDQNFDGLKETVIELLNGMHCKADPSTSQNDMTTFKTRDDVLTLLVYLGYLGFDEDREEVFIPNQEISMEFMRAVKVGGWEGLIKNTVPDTRQKYKGRFSLSIHVLKAYLPFLCS